MSSRGMFWKRKKMEHTSSNIEMKHASCQSFDKIQKTYTRTQHARTGKIYMAASARTKALARDEKSASST